MNVRAAAGVLFLFLIVVPAFPQCSYQPVFSDQFRSTFLDLAIDGNDLWAATSYGVALYDRSADPPAFVASLALPDTTRVVRIANGFAYAASGSTVRIVRKNGRALTLTGTVNAGAQVNDLVVTPLDLYVATSNGLLQFDLLDLTQPRATLTTSTPTIFSLALQGATLYAADGDGSVQVFDLTIPTIPQAVGSLATAIPRVTSVHLANGKLYVSDGHSSEVWFAGGSSSSRLGTTTFGMTSVAQINGDAVFAGAGDRSLSAYDFTTASQPLAIFATTIPVSQGTANRVSALATTQNRLYVAAGDSGLLTYDMTGFAPPFPLRDYPFSAPASIVSFGDHVYVGNSPAWKGVEEFSQTTTASLTRQRSFDGSRTDTVQDGGSGLLLTSSGATATLWTVTQATPIALSNVTFAKNVTSAVLIGTTAYALLSDSTFWSADVSQAAPTPVPIAIPNASPTSLARSGSSIALAEPRSDGTTNVIFFASAAGAPQSQSIAGVTTTPVALSGTTAAVFTFSGISLIDFASGTVTVVPQSGGVVARDLAIGPSLILEMTDANLNVWDRTTLKLTAQYPLPRTPSALAFAADAATPIADLATSDGITTIALNTTAHMPAAIPVTNPNAFYKKVVATPERVALFDGIARVDVYTPAMHHTGSLAAPGMVDIAVSGGSLFAAFSNATIAAYTIDGSPVRQTTISDLPDAAPLAVATAGNALWVAISRGCSTGACEKRTLIYNATLAQTATLPGGVVDVAVNGNRAYALFDLPAEVRSYDITDPLHPALLATVATDGSRTPVSLALANGTLYVLGEKLYAYDAASLTKTGEQLASYAADPTSPVSYVDQRVRTDGGCAVIGGRAFGATLYTTGPAWTAAASPAAPSPVRSIAAEPGTFYLLTDHSLEIWSTSAMPSLPKKHAAR